MPIHCFETTFSTPGLKLPARSVLVNEAGRGILFSPIAFSDQQVSQIRSIGEVTDIVAPCLFHHLSVPRSIDLFPKAKIWGVPGFKEKRPDIPWSDVINEANWPYRDFLEICQLQGVPKMNEAEFFHRPSKTLIATDLIFNMARPAGWLAPILLRMMGNYDGIAVSRLLGLLTQDKEALQQSLGKVLQWDFDGIVMSHGARIEKGGPEKLRAALRKRGLTV